MIKKNQRSHFSKLFFIDLEILETIEKWKTVIESASLVKVGETKVKLEHKSCEYEECNLGNFYTDAILRKVIKNNRKSMHFFNVIHKNIFDFQFLSLTSYNNKDWTNVSLALAAAGELHLSLPMGGI